jgi:hypothetical protein
VNPRTGLDDVEKGKFLPYRDSNSDSSVVQPVGSSYIDYGIFGLKKDEEIGGWRKLRNEKFHNLYALPSVIRINTSKKKRWSGNVARMDDEREGMNVGYWRKRPEEGNH